MTDDTQPEAREFTMSQYASKDDMIGAMRKRIAELEAALFAYASEFEPNSDGDPDVGSIHTNIRAMKAKLASIGAGEVQALSAAPEAIAKLRHLYQNMVNGAVRDTASAKRIAEGLLAPAIEALERATPPAEQQAAPKAAPGDAIDAQTVAAPQPAPHLPERDASLPAERQGLFRKFAVGRVDGSDKPGGKHYGCTYFVLDVDHDPCARPALAAYAAACESTHPTLAADLRTKWGVVPAPQPTPAPVSERERKDLKEANHG